MKHLAVLSLLVLISCSDSGPSAPASELTSGTATLAGAITSRGQLGFSFAQGSVLLYPEASGSAPDMAALAIIDDQGDLVGVFLAPVAQDVGFALVDSCTADAEATAAFDSWVSGNAPELEELAIPVLRNQIWLVRTGEAKWAKILILHAAVGEGETEGGDPTAFPLVTFAWVLQGNGELMFE